MPSALARRPRPFEDGWRHRLPVGQADAAGSIETGFNTDAQRVVARCRNSFHTVLAISARAKTFRTALCATTGRATPLRFPGVHLPRRYHGADGWAAAHRAFPVRDKPRPRCER